MHDFAARPIRKTLLAVASIDGSIIGRMTRRAPTALLV
jgi:hypothetical protein